MTDQVLQKLIEFLQNASPLVWHIFIKQVYIDAATNIVLAIILLVPFVVLVRGGNRARIMLKQEQTDRSTNESADHWEGMAWAYYLSSAFPGIASFILFTTAIGYLINPEYYVIQMILSKITGGS
jgi:hypothetical protein